MCDGICQKAGIDAATGSFGPDCSRKWPYPISGAITSLSSEGHTIFPLRFLVTYFNDDSAKMRLLMHGLPLWVRYQKSAHNFQPLNCYKALFRSMASSPARLGNHFQYHYIEDVERLEKYRPGGCHPIAIGDELHARYRVLYKLGHGSYSTTWLARDALSQKLVALKVGIAESNLHEVDVLSALTTPQNHISFDSPGRAMIPSILDSFHIHGTNGIRPCYVTAPARASLFDVQEASYHRVFQLNVARALAAQLALAVVFTHSKGSVHGGEFLPLMINIS